VPLGASEGETAVFSLAREGDTEALRQLLESDRAAARARFPMNGDTPLHVAARMGRTETVRLLLEFGAHPGAKDEKGATPIHSAAWRGHVEVLDLLLRNGVNPDSADMYGRTALAYALRASRNEVADRLLKWGARVDPWSAALKGDTDRLRTLLRQDPGLIAWRDEYENSLLHMAVFGFHLDAADFLIRAGFDPLEPNLDGVSALHVAMMNHREDAVEALLHSRRRLLPLAWVVGIGGVALGLLLQILWRRRRLAFMVKSRNGSMERRTIG